MPHDVRAVANWVLDLAEQAGLRLTNFSVNKVVFFLHADYLLHYKTPLVGAKIEAWKHGPVFRELYSSFKQYENKHVESRILRIDATDGREKLCVVAFEIYEEKFLEALCKRYIRMSASALYNLSHQAGGPWDRVWNHDDEVNAFMQITDEAILKWWSNQTRQ